MSDASSTETFSVASAREAGALDQTDPSSAKLGSSVAGYCAECGTWDAHGLVCSACGYDFGGAITG